MDKFEQLDRRAFLRGLTITAAGLLVPKPVQVFVPAPAYAIVQIHDSLLITGTPPDSTESLVALAKEVTKIWAATFNPQAGWQVAQRPVP